MLDSLLEILPPEPLGTQIRNLHSLPILFGGLILINRPVVPGGARGPRVPWHPQILADQLTLFQPGGSDYARRINTGTPGFSDFSTALKYSNIVLIQGKCILVVKSAHIACFEYTI